MSIINQPFQGQLGDILISELENGYTKFTIFSAFAKNSGVLRLKDSIEKFKSTGTSLNRYVRGKAKEKDQQQHFKLLPLVLKPLISRHFCLCLFYPWHQNYRLHLGRGNGLNVHSTREQIIPLCMREHIRSMHHPPSGHWIRLLFILWTIAE